MTTQVQEEIIINGEKYSLINCPSFPDSIIQPKKNLKYYRESSACWRGYVGTWEVKDDRLYLVDLSSANYELVDSPPIFADWISACLKIATGESNSRFDTFDIPIYETEMHLTIENGLVVKTKNISFKNKIRYIEYLLTTKHLNTYQNRLKNIREIIKEYSN